MERKCSTPWPVPMSKSWLWSCTIVLQDTTTGGSWTKGTANPSVIYSSCLWIYNYHETKHLTKERKGESGRGREAGRERRRKERNRTHTQYGINLSLWSQLSLDPSNSGSGNGQDDGLKRPWAHLLSQAHQNHNFCRIPISEKNWNLPFLKKEPHF